MGERERKSQWAKRLKRKSLNLTAKEAEECMDSLAKEMSNAYDIDVEYGDRLNNGDGFTIDGFDGDFYIYIGSSLEETGSVFKHIDDVEFLKCICAFHHEEQHIKQNCKLYQNKNPNENVTQSATRKIASSENRSYYKDSSRYYNDLSEIDAEYTALVKTYEFIQKNFKHADADALMLRLINDKSKSTDGNRYYITGPFDSFDNALQAFRQHYEQAKTAKVAYTIPELRLSQEVDPEKDECVRFLQTCVKIIWEYSEH